MDTAQHYGAETRLRLLEVACELFAEMGYEQTTLALISERAQANKASVNYHFRSKESLYQECWRLVLRRSNEVHPPEGGVPADAPAEARLRGRIHGILARMADPANREFQLLFRELVSPTSLLAEVLQESLEPMHDGFAAVVGELLGPKAMQFHQELCLRSIMAQCMDLVGMERRRASLPLPTAHQGPPMLNADLETVTNHIVRFSLAGIRETRKYLEATA
jgi:TetR/AcrR family transcriptional regulator, regulator of cefoperazone and chloramphenicol sensitivity